ncbi:cysteinyl-tRNA synthetase [Thermoascus aurantiacus ATCC 26904]
MATRQRPPWQQPPSYPVPLDPNGGKVKWYACGPTVYDDVHLGHARNYIDILRRILRDYSNPMQQHLFSQYVAAHSVIDAEVIKTAGLAYTPYVKENLPLLDPQVQPENFHLEVEKTYGSILRGGVLEGNKKPEDDEAKIKMHIKTVSESAKMEATAKMTEMTADSSLALEKRIVPSENFYSATQDIFLPYLDGLKGSTIDEVTRVAEYVPEIVDFVKIIVENKFGYITSDGSVYFDIKAFETAGNHYARIEPWNRNNQRLQFALSKASQPGEPSWSSPWGQGRPGWYIECSAMASSRLGSQIDIHSGGIDLAFPHYDNELAQSEAHWNENRQQWVNYFLYMGHLSIQGSKTSKSLKNFTTIREALGRRDWTPRSLRIVFLLGGWREGMGGKNSFDTPGVMNAISELISTFNTLDKSTLDPKDIEPVTRWVTSMVNILEIGWSGIDIPEPARPFLYPLSAMRDSLRKLAKSGSQIISNMLKDIVDASSTVERAISDASRLYADALSDFQARVSSLRPEESPNISKELLSLCDRVRDIDLSNLGIYLEARDNSTAEFSAWDEDGIPTKDAA